MREECEAAGCHAPVAVTISMNTATPPYSEDKAFCGEHGERIVAIGGGKWIARTVSAA